MNAGEREGLRRRCNEIAPALRHLVGEFSAAEMESLLDALEVAERKVAAVEALVDAWPTGNNGQDYRHAVNQCAAAIRVALAAEDAAELPPRAHRNGPRSDSGPESGQGDHRDDEGRSGAQEEGK